MTIKASAFKRFGPFSEERYCEDTQLGWRLAKAGYTIQFDPNFGVYHTVIMSPILFMKRKYKHGATFAKLRIDEENWSLARRCLYIFLSPLMPFHLLFKCSCDVFLAKKYRWQFLRTLPATFLALTLWSLGELMGYLNFKNN